MQAFSSPADAQMSALELYYEAERLVKLHGARAQLYCAVQGRRTLGLGDLVGSDRWEKLRAVIDTLHALREKAAA